MLHSFLLSSILTLSVTYSSYSYYGDQYVWKSGNQVTSKKVRSKPQHNIPEYMWDLYKNGVNPSEVDVVKGVFPKFVGVSFKPPSYRNHRRKELRFTIPESDDNEILVKSELRIMISEIKNLEISFQIYVKSNKWIFLDEKKVSDNQENWISLKVMQKKLSPGSITFMILTLSPEIEENPGYYPLQPILLLSYYTRNSRRKRSLESEDYEEKTNRIWQDEKFLPKRIISSCRRKPLYIKFSDIDYDSWIVAPAGYEAFQCVGKCTFPVSEHLSPTKHAILQTLLHNISPSKASRACCVPTRLDPISILYVDGNGVLTYRFRYRDMVVAECGCR